jgi:hypothetical protein
MTIAESIRVVRWVLVRNVLYNGSGKAYKLTFTTVFGIKVVITYFPTLAPISIINKF